MNEIQRLKEEIAILRIEKEQMKNDALFYRKKADEYLRQLKKTTDLFERVANLLSRVSTGECFDEDLNDLYEKIRE